MLTSRARHLTLVAAAILSIAACTSDNTATTGASQPDGGGSAAPTSTNDGAATTTTTTTAGSTTTAPPVTATLPAATTTVAPPPPTGAPTTAAPAGSCEGSGGIPAGAEIGTTISGDIDGDLADDTVTEYSLGGVPHVHAQLATGGHSDAVVQIGFADHVGIKFTDFDHAAGADPRPPVAVMATGAASAGTKYFSILTLNTSYCIRPWRLGGAMFVGYISQQGPYQGLWCDGAAGHIYYSLTEVADNGDGTWDVTTRLMHHNFTTLTLDSPQTFTVTMTDAEVRDLYANLDPC